ncbi:hypothetical protein OPT61_g2598 [Boeremia exigua]|uniref:Uncharacterized protein n=1 Tax=Boeremia exigua TaxID=749465 RepID=A0ACC2IKZ1_9PLEO|nr:hypothetical protein OPT61_g2598 [Boeremia exigua]
MKLACLRCKRKKHRSVLILGVNTKQTKCNRAEPVCHQCVTAKAECQYVERRQRPRLAQQRIATASLGKRLELLEKHISNSGHFIESDSQRPRSVSTSLTTSTPDDVSQDPASISPPNITLQPPESGEGSWVYRLANDTKRQFQSQTTPISTPGPQIDQEMSALNDALEDLGKLRLRGGLIQGKVIFNITPEEAKQCIECFIEMMNTVVLPAVFASALDINLLRSLPYLIGSPLVKVDPGIHVMYFAALQYGLSQTRGPGHVLTQTAYLKALEHVPAWLEAPTGTDMDGYTAALSSCAAINNLDYQMAWKLHLKACHYLKSKGIDKLDTVPASTNEEEERREPTRFLYWQVVAADCLFRLFWGKPSLKWDPKNVKPSAILSVQNMHPDPVHVALTCVWSSCTTRTIEQLDSIDNAKLQGLSVSHGVNECCRKLEDSVTDWKMETILEDTTVKFKVRCLVADIVMNIYAIIVGLKRLANRVDGISIVDATTVRAARKIVVTLLEFEQGSGTGDQAQTGSQTYFFHFMNFYPFCSVFTLYEHIMACTNPDDCEEDVCQLERVADVMDHTSKTIRPDLKPFTETIKALNRVSRTIQDSRRSAGSAVLEGQQSSANTLRQDTRTVNSNMFMPYLDPSAFDTIPDFPMTIDGDPDPLGFVRAMENDFIGRKWNEHWWDMGGGMDSGMPLMANSTSPGQQQTAFSIPTPHT